MNNHKKRLITYYLSLFAQQKGFTIIELLVVIIVIIAIGTVVSGILVSTLRGSNKVKTINNLEGNGNYVISQVSKMVRFAKKFDGISTDGTTYTTNCAIPTPGVGTPTPTPQSYQAVKVTSYDTGQTTFSCTSATSTQPANIASNSALLLDTSSVTLSTCTFTCEQSSPSDYPTIGIKFTLTQFTPTNGTIFLPENTASADFQTAVTPRNINR